MPIEAPFLPSAVRLCGCQTMGACCRGSDDGKDWARRSWGQDRVSSPRVCPGGQSFTPDGAYGEKHCLGEPFVTVTCFKCFVISDRSDDVIRPAKREGLHIASAETGTRCLHVQSAFQQEAIIS